MFISSSNNTLKRSLRRTHAITVEVRTDISSKTAYRKECKSCKKFSHLASVCQSNCHRPRVNAVKEECNRDTDYSGDSDDSIFKIEELLLSKEKENHFSLTSSSQMPQTATKLHLIANSIPVQRATWYHTKIWPLSTKQEIQRSAQANQCLKHLCAKGEMQTNKPSCLDYKWASQGYKQEEDNVEAYQKL